ncbi:MAG: 4Fe-4S dicluster domain-containing protein [Candidatus Mcinerneyibacterium aminivorans]|uniref:4Fe-4S dicluster domain-containing protein n=1 Tax=Candidatus Mcinerneyibacterium aminivorans TaxID=2703815 RepID=A0A5D0MJV7_9BACT|nr:MAG: 4Fe-4S dicluster domain-containing protein [Candidatus Mcinerneyibacterium aminivorans]
MERRSNMCIDFDKIKNDFSSKEKNIQKRIIICAGTGCVANGSLEVYEEFVKILEDKNMDVVVDLHKENDENKKGYHVSKSGCQGFCQMGPLVAIEPEGILYVKIKPEDVKDIVEKTIKNNEIINEYLYTDPKTEKFCETKEEIPFYREQKRYVLKECGVIDPSDIKEYIYRGGYESAKKVYTEYSPKEVCEEISRAGLRGRGGGGFPTGKKWEFTRVKESKKKYIICNGDEGDPGAFMDRSIMEGNPHSVIEGMMIAAKAVGADKGYIYVRTEYPLAVKRIKKAIKDAEEMNILGDNIFGTDESYHLEVMEGAGAFVCGEETALMSSIEGKRGMPMPKPPYPADKGLWEKPTVINNVETLATVPLIIRDGSTEFKKIGTENSPGTKVFALTGNVPNTGLIEVPFGTTIREIIYDIGGGVLNKDGKIDNDSFKAVQIGGPSGGCLTEEELDIEMDFDKLVDIGAMVGSGGLVVIGKNTCIVQVAQFFMQFTQNESCGKCVPCREGTKQLLALLNEIIDGKGNAETLDELERLSKVITNSSLCGLGKTAPSPVLSTLKNFRAEYEAHVIQDKCIAGECEALLTPEIDPEKCRGCTLCSKVCPVDAIEGEPKKVHTIDEEKCIKCGSCAEKCNFEAIKGV